MCNKVGEGQRCASHTREEWTVARNRATADRETADDTTAYRDQLTEEVARTVGWTPRQIDLDRVTTQAEREVFQAEVSARQEHAALVEYASTPGGRSAVKDLADNKFMSPQDREQFTRALAKADDRLRFTDQATAPTRVVPNVDRMTRSEFNGTVKKVLRERSGKQWSVTGDSGTAYGWIRVTAPKSRLVDHDFMSDEDRTELGLLLGHDQPVHRQGETTSPDNWQSLMDRACTGATTNYKPADWD